MILTDRFNRAIETAAWQHRNQARKGEPPFPYIVHPFALCILLSEYTDDEDVFIAALLHDTIEDTDYTENKMRQDFGDRVANLVLEVTEAPKPDVAWKDRKTAYIEKLKKASTEGCLIAAADKIHNMRTSIYSLPAEFAGQRVWFHEAVFDAVRERLGEHPIVEEYKKVLDEHRDFVNNSEK